MNKILLCGAVLMVVLANATWAANYDNPMQGIFRGVYGHQIMLEIPSLVSKSPDMNGNQPGKLAFEITSSTAFVNFNQLTDLRNGDTVSVGYVIDDNNKLKDLQATAIRKEVPVQAIVEPVADVDQTQPTPTSQTVTTVTTTTSNNN